MTGRVQIRERAKLDLEEQAEYIRGNSLQAAARFLDAARQSMDALAKMPGLGSPTELPSPRLRGLRCCTIRGFEKHLIFYSPRKNGIEVVRVLQGARDLPAVLGQ